MIVACIKYSYKLVFRLTAQNKNVKYRGNAFTAKSRTKSYKVCSLFARFIFHGPISQRVELREEGVSRVIKQSAKNPT